MKGAIFGNYFGRLGRLRKFAMPVLLLFVLAPAFAQTTQSAVTPLGSFADMKINDEHCNGYAVDLWRDGETLIGLLHYCAGLVETKTNAVIEAASLDKTTGALSFTARLSIGTDFLPGGREVASRNVWDFRGALVANRLSGDLTKRDEANPRRTPQHETLRLSQRRAPLASFATLDDWRRWAAAQSGTR